MRMKYLNSCAKVGKCFRGVKASQLNHYKKPVLEKYEYDRAIIHVSINDIFSNKNDTDMKNLVDREITNTCQNYHIDKMIISAILPSKRIKINISQINKTLKTFMFQKQFHVFRAWKNRFWWFIARRNSFVKFWEINVR